MSNDDLREKAYQLWYGLQDKVGWINPDGKQAAIDALTAALVEERDRCAKGIELAMGTLRQHCVCRFEDVANGHITEVIGELQSILNRSQKG